MKRTWSVVNALTLWLVSAVGANADREVRLLDVPDYGWWAGCFGTATGNLMGYWDRHGLPNFYTGLAGGGVAPLDSSGENVAIRSMWASQAGLDGRPANQPGHMDDYYSSYESTAEDPYRPAGRPEHPPDCIGDFIGLSQKKWANMNGECDGNVDAYSFVFWNTNGGRRTDFQPTNNAGLRIPDIPSGLRAWAQYRGYDAEVFSQLCDFNPTVPSGTGFSFRDLKAQIDAGFPVLLFLQDFTTYSRRLDIPILMPKANPLIHGMLAYGYAEYPAMGVEWVYYRTSWGLGEYYSSWNSSVWQANMPVRGVIGFRPKPRIRSITRSAGSVTLAWDGPSSQLNDTVSGLTTTVPRYQLERSTSLTTNSFNLVGSPTTERSMTFEECCATTVFYRVKLLTP